MEWYPWITADLCQNPSNLPDTSSRVPCVVTSLTVILLHWISTRYAGCGFSLALGKSLRTPSYTTALLPQKSLLKYVYVVDMAEAVAIDKGQQSAWCRLQADVRGGGGGRAYITKEARGMRGAEAERVAKKSCLPVLGVSSAPRQRCTRRRHRARHTTACTAAKARESLLNQGNFQGGKKGQPIKKPAYHKCNSGAFTRGISIKQSPSRQQNPEILTLSEASSRGLNR
ncbi:hypothetical protein GQ54DRAFT_117069 [Martensiomyces pterosporus]|nr:hypothetical protein GQ54DRAFT_117069 [Martensiomyces pterosporus]